MFLSGLESAKAHNWISEYSNALGTDCCGIKDCEVIPYKRLQVINGIYFFKSTITKTDIQINAVHISQDGQIWACLTGCLFLPAFSRLEELYDVSR